MTDRDGTNWARICTASTQGLSEDDGAALEARVAADGGDIDARVRLIGFYLGQHGGDELQRRRGRHVTWLVEDRPDIGLSGYGSMIPENAPEEYDAIRSAWLAAVERPDVDARLLENAATFLGFTDPASAEPLFGRHARAGRVCLASSDRADSDATGRVGGRRPRAPLLRPHRAGRARGRAGADESSWRGAQRQDRPRRGRRPGRGLGTRIRSRGARPRGLRVGQEIMELRQCHSLDEHRTWRDGFAQGDTPRAAGYLLRAGKTPGSPQLNSFGPDRAFASKLLAAGQREAVLAYLGDCRRFWAGKEDLLDGWKARIAVGDTSEVVERYDEE